MGYELDRLMNQYGVGSPSLSYSGISKPVDPGAFSYTAPAEGVTGPTEAEARSSWQALVDKYNADSPTYAADQAAYQAFKPLYSGRIASTPQYLQSQYQTWKPPTSQSNIQKVQAWLSANPMAPDYQIKAKLAEFGLDRQDLFNATGDYWGNTLTKNSPAGVGGNTEGLPSVVMPPKQPISPYADVSKPPVPLQPPGLGKLPYIPPVVTSHEPVVPATPVTTREVPESLGIDPLKPAKNYTPLIFPSGINEMTPQEKAGLYNSLIGQGYTDNQIHIAANQQFGYQPDDSWAYLTNLAKPLAINVTQDTAEKDKAAEYNRLLKEGRTDAQIRAAADTQFGKQSDYDWNYLQQSANSLAGQKPTTGQPALTFDPGTSAMNEQQKADYYNTLLGQGYTDQQIHASANQQFGNQTNTDWNYLTNLAAGKPAFSIDTLGKGLERPLTFDQSIGGQSADQKAAYYNSLIGQGYSDQQIHNAANTAFGNQSDADWGTLRGLAGYSHGGSVRTHFQSGGLNEMAEKYNTVYADPQDVASVKFVAPGDSNYTVVPVIGGRLPTPEQAQMIQRDIVKNKIQNPFINLKDPSEQPTQALADMPGAGASREDQVRTELMAMLNRQQQSAYGEEYRVARERSDRETQAFQDMITKAVAGQADQGPSQAEKYFRLAAAFGAPTKTGGLGESLGNAAQVLSEYNKEQRTAQRAGQMQALQLGLQGQQARMTAARDEASQLRQLTGEELKAGQADKIKLLDYYMKALEPQSPEGKAARDKGLIPGTKDYQEEVGRQLGIKQDDVLALKRLLAETARGNTAFAQSIAQQGLELRQTEAERKAQEAKRLTPTEMKLKSETEDLVSGLDASLAALSQAYKLNPTTFDNSVIDRAQRKILEEAGSTDPKVVNTRLQENLLQEKALAGLKAAFGSNPTEGERAILLQVQGIGAKSKEERKQIMLTAAAALKTKRMQQAKRLNEINQGLYRDTTPAVEGLE